MLKEKVLIKELGLVLWILFLLFKYNNVKIVLIRK